MSDLTGKVAVVTGSGRGIGREIAIRLAREGASVTVNVKKRIEDGRATLDMVNEFSPGMMVQTDVSTRDGCRKLMRETLEEFGRCDVLVNNAGIGIAAPFLESDDGLINKIISTNLLSNVYCCQEFGKVLEPGGSIVIISSMAGIRPMPMLSLYGITKAALIKMTEYLSIELASKGIRVNAIAPSVVKTKMGDSLLELLNTSAEEYGSRYTLTGKIIYPEEIADAVVFLLRSKSITGQTLVIDSGQSLMSHTS